MFTLKTIFTASGRDVVIVSSNWINLFTAVSEVCFAHEVLNEMERDANGMPFVRVYDVTEEEFDALFIEARNQADHFDAMCTEVEAESGF